MPPAADLRRAVLFRTDRIGDVILTMPAILAVAKAHPKAEVSVVSSRVTAPLFLDQPRIKEVFVWDHSMHVRPLRRFLGENRFDTAVAFFPHYKIAYATWRAEIPVRIGTGYRWYSPLFTRRVLLHRALNLKHELEYNFDLVAQLGVPAAGASTALVHPILPAEAREAASDILSGAKTGGPYVAIHPGSGGSALNAGPEYYGRVARAIEDAGYRVVFTGTPRERDLCLAALRAAELPEHRLLATEDLMILGVILHWATAVIAPSTGPLHLAAAFDTPTIGLYPPVRSQSPVRWGPRGPKGVVLVPAGVPPCQRCFPRWCRRYNCMERITPEMVVAALKTLLPA